MEYVRLGRRLGIGTRLAAKLVREQAEKAAAKGEARIAKGEIPRATAQAPDAESLVRKAARGGGGFARAFWKPMSSAAWALWYEVTGVFFALFAIFFGQETWRLRGAWRSGADHTHFAVYLAFTLVFVYFSLTAFVRARRRPR